MVNVGMVDGKIARRTALRWGCGLALAGFGAPAWSFAPKEFWNERDPEAWTPSEIKELLSKSPWVKEAGIKDNGQVGSLGSPRSTRGNSRSSSSRNGGNGGGTASGAPSIEWKAIVRWDSALPLRAALKDFAPKDAADFYVLNVIGNLPNAIPSPDEPEDRGALPYLKEVTTLQHKGDAIHLARVDTSPAASFSPAGTRFYFSRMLALMPEDKEASFTTRMGPLELKCKFSLRDMFYRGNLEL